MTALFVRTGYAPGSTASLRINANARRLSVQPLSSIPRDGNDRSSIFRGRPAMDVLLAAGTRAVASYPMLTAGGDPFGVLSFHYDGRPPPARAADVTSSAARALSHVRADGRPKPVSV